MIRTDKRIRLCTALLICNLIFIWGNSLLPGEISAAFSDWVKELLAKIFAGDPTESSGRGLLRKLAHFTEFLGLGMCLAWLHGMLGKGKLRPFLWGVAAASVDETIQRFVPDRGPSIKDVCIDSAGVLTGIILLWTGYHYLKRRFTK
jgi:VanZ family protein